MCEIVNALQNDNTFGRARVKRTYKPKRNFELISYN
jgi:hypothetical protein